MKQISESAVNVDSGTYQMTSSMAWNAQESWADMNVVDIDATAKRAHANIDKWLETAKETRVPVSMTMHMEGNKA